MTDPIDVSPAVREVILAFADDEHMMGQQHTEWIGVTPFFEEDLAFASIGQDELGHAALLLELLVGDDDQAIDEIAFYREPDEWRSCALTECTLPDWCDTLVRHWLYDAAEELRWQLFSESSVPELAALSTRALSEERFHRRHADAMIDALFTVDDARERITESLARLLPVAHTMFDGVAGEGDAIAQGAISGRLADIYEPWQQRTVERFAITAWIDDSIVDAKPQRTERHGDFAPMLARIREVFDLDRSAVW